MTYGKYHILFSEPKVLVYMFTYLYGGELKMTQKTFFQYLILFYLNRFAIILDFFTSGMFL